jgi:hypothetical protein
MAVSLWVVLGIVLTMLSAPFVYLVTLPFATPGLGLLAGTGLGAGCALIVVGVAQWWSEDTGAAPDEDLGSDPT